MREPNSNSGGLFLVDDCAFCSQPETTQHLFSACPIANLLWYTVGRESLLNDSCEWWLTSRDKHFVLITVCFIWCIWTIRNETIFRSRSLDFDFCFFRLLALLRKWSY